MKQNKKLLAKKEKVGRMLDIVAYIGVYSNNEDTIKDFFKIRLSKLSQTV